MTRALVLSRCNYKASRVGTEYLTYEEAKVELRRAFKDQDQPSRHYNLALRREIAKVIIADPFLTDYAVRVRVRRNPDFATCSIRAIRAVRVAIKRKPPVPAPIEQPAIPPPAPVSPMKIRMTEEQNAFLMMWRMRRQAEWITSKLATLERKNTLMDELGWRIEKTEWIPYGTDPTKCE